jgi:hypothetical protein
MAKGSKKRGQASTAPSATSTTIGGARNPIRDQLPSILVFRPHDVSTPAGIASAYKTLAAEISQAARSMPFPDSVAQHIVVFHAIEVALKGYLVHSGLTEKKLKNEFSHDLEKLFAEAKARGLIVNVAHADELIAWCNEYHKYGLIRYDIDSFRELPMCEAIFPIVDAIVTAIPTPAIRV